MCYPEGLSQWVLKKWYTDRKTGGAKVSCVLYVEEYAVKRYYLGLSHFDTIKFTN